MSYANSRHYRFADFQDRQPRRGRGDSDATLVDYQPTKSPEPALQRDQRGVRYGYEPSRNPFCDPRRSHRLEGQPRTNPQCKQRYLNGSQLRPPTCLKQSPQTSSPAGHSPTQKRRSVHFDDDGDSYGLVDGKDECEELYTPHSTRSRRTPCDNYSDLRTPGLPRPVTAPQHPAGNVPFNYLVLPPKEKKPSTFKRLRESFVSVTTDPDLAFMGFTPGQPTPQHLIDKEAEEEVIEEAKRAEEQKRKDELVRQSKLRRFNAFNARKAERLAQEARTQSQQEQMRRASEYNSQLIEAYAREYDSTHGSKRMSSHPKS